MEYKLEDLFTLQMGKTPSRNNPEYWDSPDQKWISISDLSKCGKYISETKEYISDKAVEESGISLIPENTVIMSFKLSIGKVAITAQPMYSNEAIMSFRDKRVVELLPDYVYYLLLGHDWAQGTNKAVMGKTLNKATLSQIKVRIHPLETQHSIVSTLDKLQSIITHRKQQLAKLDELVKARFVEMFGDPVTNNMNWETQTVETVCSDIYGGGTPSKAHPEYYENGDIPWVSSKDMKTDIITESQIYINHLGVKNSTAKKVHVNSVIMVIRSGIMLHPLAVAINAVPITVNQDLKVFLPDKCITAFFLSTLFKMLENDILSGVRAVTADNIEFNSLKQRQIIVPPLDLQIQFTAFIEQINKSKVAVQKALDEAQLLFDSLMQEYFG